MPQNALESLEEVKKPDSLDLEVESNHEAAGVRTKINTLLDTFERQKLARPKMIAEYRQAAENDKSLEGLQEFYHWILGKWQDSMWRLNAFHAEFDRAIREGIAGENDREFLMKALILTDRWDFVGQTDQIADKLKEKLKDMKKRREEYDRFRHHKLVEYTGFLRVDAATKIDIPDEKKFLSLSVPDRRALLDKLREVLPKAKAYAEKTGTAESGDLVKQYDELLKDAQFKRRIIGSVTARKFREGFRVIDTRDKREWIGEFQNQMKRYEDLWHKIRTTLKDEPLAKLEAQREEKGYTELFTAFGKAVEQESKTLCGCYDLELKKLHEEGVISVHTRNAFLREIRQKDFAEQKRYFSELPNQMQRYRELRANIKALPKKAQAELEALYKSPDLGYQEIHQRYLELSGKVDVKPSDALNQKMQALQGIRRERVRKNVVWSEALLETDDEKQKMVYRLDRLIANREAGRYDQESYAKSAEELRKKRVQKKAQTPFTPSERSESTAETAADESLSIASLRAQNRKMEAKSGEGVELTSKADDAFHMTRVTVGQEDHKVIRFGIGDRRAAKAFLQEEVRLEGRDEIHLMAKEGGIDRMTFEEIRHFRNYLKTSLQAA